MADKPIREQSALELLETHAKALEEENARLRAALAETEQKLDGWYRLEARLHAAIHRHGGGDAIRAAIAELSVDPKAHNPRLAVETTSAPSAAGALTGEPSSEGSLPAAVGADRKCNICDGTGLKHRGMKYRNVDTECWACGGTGRVAVETAASLNVECLSCGQRYEAVKGHLCPAVKANERPSVIRPERDDDIIGFCGGGDEQ